MDKPVYQFGVQIKSETDEIKIEEKKFKYTRITNIDEIYAALATMDDQQDDVTDERIPYWTELWPSAIALSEFVVANPQLFTPDFLFHEIGCGLALPAMVCAHLGYRVVISDYADPALSFAIQNAKLNELDFSESYLLDWRNIPEDFPQCHVLLAADVAYEKRMFNTIIDVFDKLVLPDGIILFAEPKRSYAKEFYDMLQQKGFLIDKKEKPVTVKDFTHFVNVCIVRKK
ncbi:MAG: hypothetical protein JSS90_01130 [Bacteroidetes bacterium]|jgi:predicted nicotinamide N-methyase|nr:hypothetical protein [Bacteroidota bacterium]